MLNELAPLLPSDCDLPAKLDDKKLPQNAIGAEMELALLWGISRVADLEIGPTRFPIRARPDAYSANLFPQTPSVIEIRTVSDEGLLREKAMRQVASKIIQIANRARRGSGRFLYFQFVEISKWENGQYIRHSRVTEKYAISEQAQAKIVRWIANKSESNSLRITDPSLDLVIMRKNHPQHKLG